MGVGIGVAVVLLGLGFAIATRPDTFRIERSATLAAPADVVFSYVNDFHRWADWSPWEKLDPNLKRTYEGATSGVGAIYGWQGNSKAGQGTMTVRESKPNARIVIDLHFIKPFAAENLAEFTFKPTPGAVEVTWSMSGKNPLFRKAFGLFIDMDNMIGKDFERGLANLGAAAKAASLSLASAPLAVS